MTRLIVGLVLGLLPWVVGAQELELRVNIDKTRFVWDAPIGGATSEFYRVSCGHSAGVHDVTSNDVQGAANTQMPVSSVITVPGNYFCVVRAGNSFGLSDKSNEVAFSAGYVPAVPLGFHLEAE